jgi:SAM-dependent methyltransferase
VPAVDLRPAANDCPLCGEHLERKPVWPAQSDPAVDFLQCPVCRGASASRMPADTFLASFYDGYYAPAESRTTFDGAQRFAAHILAGLPRDFPRGARRESARAPQERLRVLDFGGGDGSLALAVASGLRDRGLAREVEILVADSHAPATANSPRIFVRRADLADLEPRDRFDLVLASAVLEHVPDFDTTLRRLLDRLAPEGIFYARTPWMLPWRRLVPGLDLAFPAHLHDVGGDCWNHLSRRHASAVHRLVSRPSVVHVSWRSPLLAAAIYAWKLPGRLEARARPGHAPWWRLVGGWEVFWRATDGVPA